jgi:4-aminobutyrate aminotransferase-like enzyme
MIAAVAVLLTDAPARFLVLQDPLAVTDAVVVMAGDPDYERTLTAARLVRAKQARLLILTGGQRSEVLALTPALNIGEERLLDAARALCEVRSAA